jgi:hypothetical protein
LFCRILDKFNGRAKPIRIIGDPDNKRPDKWRYTVQPQYYYHKTKQYVTLILRLLDILGLQIWNLGSYITLILCLLDKLGLQIWNLSSYVTMISCFLYVLGLQIWNLGSYMLP